MNNIDPQYIKNLLNDLESDRVERTISTTNMDKFGEAICAFANDLPDHRQPGYLIIGAEDKTGNVAPIEITDALLKNVASIRTEGNIQPQPSMSVQKVDLDDGPVLVVEVQPAHFPPVRYKGRICVRIGPRRGVANEEDERKLYEKRKSHVLTFDAMPCLDSKLTDLDLSLFRQIYLPKAYPEDVVKNDERDVRLQFQSLGFYDMQYDCPTYAGILMFGKNVEHWLPGAYVQYVRFGGKTRAGEILSEYKFAGNLMAVLNQLDTYVSTTIARKRPKPISALREENVYDYPAWSVRELLMNAICHRDYEGNGPIQFYQYDDRIEILNPGGLYGKANARNFPLVNDYRNGVVAEAMKVLGFVNRFSRGIERVQVELEENNNGLPVFNLDLESAFLVKVHIANDPGIPEKNYVQKNEGESSKSEGDNLKNEGESSKSEGDNLKNEGDKPNSEGEKLLKNNNISSVFRCLCNNPLITYEALKNQLKISDASIHRAVKKLKESGYIRRIGSDRKGHWEILKREIIK